MKPQVPGRAPLTVDDPYHGDGPTPEPVPAFTVPPAEGLADSRVRAQLWWAVGVLYSRRWVLMAVFVLSSMGAVAVALLLPVWYYAETRVLLPESGSGFGSLLETVAPGASAILGRGGDGYTRYLALLTSRTTMEAVVDRFDLVEVYDLQEAGNPREAAVGQLSQNTSFSVSLEYDYLGVGVFDRDPERAAQLANFFVERLNERHIEMNAGSAAENRRFLQTRLEEAEADLDSAQADLQAFQERYGVIQLESQADALMTSLAESQSHVAEAEIRYQALRSQYGDDNPEVETARAALQTARSQLGRLTGGGESVMPVPLQQLPAVGRRYAQIVAELRTQEEIIKAVRPLYEQAALSERRDASAVQVLDPALPPSRKAKPQRAVLVISIVLSVGLLAVALVLAHAWLRRHSAAIAARLRAVTA